MANIRFKDLAAEALDGSARTGSYLAIDSSANGTEKITIANLFKSPTLTGSPTAAGATWSDLGSVTTVDINGGTIDGAVIGGTTPAAITGTTVTGKSSTAATNTVENPFTMKHESSGIIAAGFGVGVNFQASQAAGGGATTQARILSRWTDVAGYDAAVDIYVRSTMADVTKVATFDINATASQTRMELMDSAGVLRRVAIFNDGTRDLLYLV